MKKTLSHIHFRELLPHSIRDDRTVAAAAESLNRLLVKTTDAVPNLLIWARLDREKARLMAPLARLTEAAGGLKPHSADALELLAWQFHVDFREVARDDAALERMILGSIPWHRIKGTPAAVEMALDMYEVRALVDESGRGRNWAVYELELVDVPTGSQLKNIVKVASEAAPKRCWLRRLHDEYDRRPIILDVGPPLDLGYLDDDSGVWDRENGVKLSFADQLGLRAQLYLEAASGAFGQMWNRAGLIYYLNRPILDQWVLGSSLVKSHGIVGQAVIDLRSLGLEREKYCWTGAWDGRQWDQDRFPLPRRRNLNRRRMISKSQLALDWCRLDWPLHHLDHPWSYPPAEPWVLGLYRLDSPARVPTWRPRPIEELFVQSRPSQMAQSEIKSRGPFSGASRRALHSTPIEGLRRYWTGAWDQRRWGLGGPPLPDRNLWPQAFLNLSHEEAI